MAAGISLGRLRSARQDLQILDERPEDPAGNEPARAGGSFRGHPTEPARRQRWLLRRWRQSCEEARHTARRVMSR